MCVNVAGAQTSQGMIHRGSGPKVSEEGRSRAKKRPSHLHPNAATVAAAVWEHEVIKGRLGGRRGGRSD